MYVWDFFIFPFFPIKNGVIFIKANKENPLKGEKCQPSITITVLVATHLCMSSLIVMQSTPRDLVCLSVVMYVA
jgi:hypothetical protein